MSETNNTGVKLPFCIQRPSQSTPATRVADIDDDNGVNLGTILSGKLNSTDAESTYLTQDDAQSTYEPKLTGAKFSAVNSGITAAKVELYDGYASDKQNVLSSAQMDSVNSGITTNKRSHYDSAYDVTYGSTHDVVSVPITKTKAWTVAESEGEFDVQLVNASGATVYAMASEPFKIVSNVNLSFVAGNERQTYSFYFAVLKDGEWKVVKKFMTQGQISVSIPPTTHDPDDVETEPSSTPSQPTENSSSIAKEGFITGDYIGCQCRLFVSRNDDEPLTSSDFTAISPQQIKILGETVQGTIKQYAVFTKTMEHYGSHYFRDKLYIGSPDEPHIARQIDRYFETRNAELTYKAKLVNDEYICAPTSMADNTYSLYVGVISVNPQTKPILCINSHNAQSFFAKKSNSFSVDGKIEMLGKTIDGYGESNELLIVAPSNYLWYDISELTLNAVLSDAKQSIRRLLDDYNTYAPCPWVEYNSITGTKAFPNFIGTNSQSTAWHIDIGTLVGNIEIDATKGNRIFDFRNLKDANDEPIPVDFAVNIEGFTNYETIIFFKGIDIYSISPTSPLAMSDLCFCGEEPDLDTDKEYVLSIQGNILIFGELSRGVDAETEEE